MMRDPSSALASETRDLRARFRAVGHNAAASPSIESHALPAAPIDAIGLATVLTYGYALSTRTVLQGVEADRVDPIGFARAAPPSDDEVVELTLDAIRRNIESRAGSAPIMALLSGGRDSRLILLGMLALGRKPDGVLTLDQRGAESDAAIADRLAAAVGLRAARVAWRPFSAERELERHAQQSFQSLEHEWFLPIAGRVRAMDAHVTDGIGAGVLSTGSLLDAQAIELWRTRRYDALSEWTAGHGSRVSQRFLDAARAAGLPLATHDEVLHEFSSVMRSLEGTPNPLGLYSLLHWTRRGIGASAYGLLPESRVITPLYDLELCRALAAIPMERAMARDWRELVLARIDQTGVPFSRREGGVLPRWLRYPWRATRSRLCWLAFVRELPPPLAHLARIADESPWPRRAFDRAAVGLLASLDRATGSVSAHARGA